jgi:hypothetical protein
VTSLSKGSDLGHQAVVRTSRLGETNHYPKAKTGRVRLTVRGTGEGCSGCKVGQLPYRPQWSPQNRPLDPTPSLALSVALAAYGLDCLGMATAEQAMQCCNAMRCRLHGHHRSGLLQYHAPDARCSRAALISTRSSVFARHARCGASVNDSQIMEVFACIIAGHSHNPPPACSKPIVSLRI